MMTANSCIPLFYRASKAVDYKGQRMMNTSKFETPRNTLMAPSIPAKLPQRRSSSSFVSTAWDISEQVLRTLTSAAQYAPTPYLGSLSVVALSIFNAVQGANENKDALKQLASVACNLVLTVSNTFKELHPSSQPQGADTAFSDDLVLNKHVEELIGTLQEIQNFITTQTSRPLLRRVVSSRSDLNIIQDYRDQLKQTMDAFQLQSLIAIRDTVSRMASQQENMNQEAARRHDSVRQTLLTIQEEFQSSNQRQAQFESRFTDDSPVTSPISSEPSSPSPFSSSSRSTPPSRSSTANSLKSNNPFASFISSSPIHRASTISVNHISGNYNVVENYDNSIKKNFNNVFYGDVVVFGPGRGKYDPSGNGLGEFDGNGNARGRGWARVRDQYLGGSGAAQHSRAVALGRRRTMSDDRRWDDYSHVDQWEVA